MKIAIILRGIIRPSAEFVSENITILKNAFKDHDVDTYLFTWSNQPYKEILDKHQDLNISAMPDLKEEDVYEYFTGKTRTQIAYPHAWKAHNSYKQFFQTTYALRYVKESRIKYDYIFLSRTDLRLDPGNVETWMSPNRYVVDSTRLYPVIGDQCAMATPDVMLKAWDYRDLSNLNDLYPGSENPETVLFKNMLNNGVCHGYAKPVVSKLYHDF